MNSKYGDWLENIYKLDFRFLSFLAHIVETFNSFNMDKTRKEMKFNF